jgi:predicted DNA-binding transcriptional regulator AlpA
MDLSTPNHRSLIEAAGTSVLPEPTAAGEEGPVRPLPKPGDRFVRKPEVLARVGACDESIRRWERKGKFPKRIRLDPSAGRQGAVAWLASEIRRRQGS